MERSFTVSRRSPFVAPTHVASSTASTILRARWQKPATDCRYLAKSSAAPRPRAPQSAAADRGCIGIAGVFAGAMHVVMTGIRWREVRRCPAPVPMVSVLKPSTSRSFTKKRTQSTSGPCVWLAGLVEILISNGILALRPVRAHELLGTSSDAVEICTVLPSRRIEHCDDIGV